MKRKIIFGIVTLAAALVLMPSSAFATCAIPALFGQVDYNCGGYFCYVVSDVAASQDDMASNFWALGSGNPTTGSGNDNGTYPDNTWLRQYVAGVGNFYMSGDWGGSDLIDGCAAGASPSETMVAGFSDIGGNFAVATAFRLAANSPEWDFTFENGGGTPQNIQLVPIPAPAIIASSPGGTDTSVNVTIQAPDLGAGFYTDGSATVEQAITGYRIYQQEVAPGAGAPTDNSRAGATLIGDTNALNADATVTATCSGDSNIYLRTSVVFDSGFETEFLSAASNSVACGPNMADPGDRFRLIDRPSKPGNGKRLRPNRDER